MSKTIHVCVDIKSALKNPDLTGLLSDEDREMSDDEVRAVLLADYRSGHDFFVGCDNRQANGRCAGHEITQDAGQ